MRFSCLRWFRSCFLLVAALVAIALPAVEPGLLATYYDNEDFTGTTLTRVDPTLDFNWGSGSPSASIGSDTFSVRWTGVMRPRYTQTYTLFVTTDDGVRVWVDGVQVINDWSLHAPWTFTATIALTADAAHTIRVDYFESGGGAMAILEWASASQAREVIPSSRLEASEAPPVAPAGLMATATAATEVLLTWDYQNASQDGFRIERQTGSGAFTSVGTAAATARRFDDVTATASVAYTYRVVATTSQGDSAPSPVATATTPATGQPGTGFITQYWDNRDFTGAALSRAERTLQFNWGYGSPDSSIASDTFSARFLGRLMVATTGIVEFRTVSDDGVRLWLDTQCVIDNLTDHAPTTDTASVVLTANQLYDVRIDYYENYGGATLLVDWRPQGGTWVPLQVRYEQPRPFAPTGFTAAAISSGPVLLAWQASGITGETVRVERRDEAGTTWTEVVAATAALTATDSTATAGTSYRYRAVTVRNNLSSSPSAEAMVHTATPGTGSGITGLYFPDLSFASVPLVRADAQVNFTWSYGAPAVGLPYDNVQVRWLGELEPALSELYTLYVTTDDGVRLWIDGALMIDDWHDHSATTSAITIPLVAAGRHAIRMEYYDHTSLATAILEWSSPHTPREVIPTTRVHPMAVDTTAPGTPANLHATWVADSVIELAWNAASDVSGISHYRIDRDGVPTGTATGLTYRDESLTPVTAYQYRITAIDWFGNVGANSAPLTVTTLATPPPGTGTGLTASYFADLNLERFITGGLDPILNHTWAAEPAVGVPADGFSSSWQGFMEPLYSETYTFTVAYDAGARLWVDGQLRASAWGGGSLSRTWATTTQTITAQVSLTARQHHTIRVDFADTAGSAAIQLRWTSHSQTPQVIPTSQLYPLVDAERFQPRITTPAHARTSPAFVEGSIGGPGVGFKAFRNGLPVGIQRASDAAWLLTESDVTVPPGILLDSAAPVELRVVASDGTISGLATQWIAWDLTDFANLPYGLTSLIVRGGDSLLLAASGSGAATFKLRTLQGVELAAWNVAQNERQPRRFDTPGVYYLTAFRGSTEIATLPLTVVGMNWRGPIACAIGFERHKLVTVLGSAPSSVVISGQDAGRTAARITSTAGADVHLGLTPLLGGTNMLVARLGSDGQIISRIAVDEFTLTSTASETAQVVEILPGNIKKYVIGMLLTPWAQPLDIKATTFIAGVTFLDGTSEQWFSASGFTPLPDGTGAIGPCYLLKPAIQNSSLCHILQAFQNGEQVSP